MILDSSGRPMRPTRRAAINDTLRSELSRIGNTERDKLASLTYEQPTVDYEQLRNAYRSSWAAQKVVNIPARDAVRNWREWQATQDQITLLENEEKRLGLRKELEFALQSSRIFGRVAIYMHTREGAADPSQPLNIDAIQRGGLQHITVFTWDMIGEGIIETDPFSPDYGRPAYYQIEGQDVHPSRLAILKGVDTSPAFSCHGGRLEGDSVLTALLGPLKWAESTGTNIARLVFEASIDILKIPQLTATLSDPEDADSVTNRIRAAIVSKEIGGALILDSEEEHAQKSANFANLPDVLMSFLQVLSGAADIPVTRFLGQAPAGLNSTGESDLSNYYDRIKAMQELDIQPALANLDAALMRSALGPNPDPEIHYVWSSLWQMSDKEKAEVGKLIAEAATILMREGLLPAEGLDKATINAMVEAGLFPGLAQEIDDATLEAQRLLREAGLTDPDDEGGENEDDDEGGDA